MAASQSYGALPKGDALAAAAAAQQRDSPRRRPTELDPALNPDIAEDDPEPAPVTPPQCASPALAASPASRPLPTPRLAGLLGSSPHRAYPMMGYVEPPPGAPPPRLSPRSRSAERVQEALEAQRERYRDPTLVAPPVHADDDDEAAARRA